MLVSELITILKNFPKRHLITLIVGAILIVLLIFIGNKNLPNSNDLPDLKKPLKLSSLLDKIDTEELLIEKKH